MKKLFCSLMISGIILSEAVLQCCAMENVPDITSDILLESVMEQTIESEISNAVTDASDELTSLDSYSINEADNLQNADIPDKLSLEDEGDVLEELIIIDESEDFIDEIIPEEDLIDDSLQDDLWDQEEEVFDASLPAVIKLKTTAYTYDGKVKTPGVIIKDSKGKTVSKNNYKLTYAKGRKAVGKYKVSIKFTSQYKGTKNLYFTIKPPKTTVKSITGITKSSAKININKKTVQTTGYQISYTGNKTTKTLSIANSKTSVSLTKLKANTKYSVKIRTYKTLGNTKYYSAWSGAKTFTTKKATVTPKPEPTPDPKPDPDPDKDSQQEDTEEQSETQEPAIPPTIVKLVLYEGYTPLSEDDDTTVSITANINDSTYDKLQAIYKAFGEKYTLKGVLSQDQGGGIVNLPQPSWYSNLWSTWGGNILGYMTCQRPDLTHTDYVYGDDCGYSYKIGFDAIVNIDMPEVDLDDDEIRDAILGFRYRSGYSEGSPWTDDTTYRAEMILDGMRTVMNAGGCAAFALDIQDQVFGKLTPVYTHDDYYDVKVGDIVRIYNNGHSVLVYDVEGTIITVCEGNYSDSVHWGRQIDLADPSKGFTYIWTRRP